MPKISVIVPVYNVEPYIRRCVDSILNQTFTDFELILIDDGSPDNCGRICDEYVKRDNRIRVIHQENGGLSSARNAGIDWAFQNSDSEWLTFIDSDDYIHYNYLEILYDAAVNRNCDLCLCSYARNLDEFPSKDCFCFSTNIVNTESFFINNRALATVACCKLYKKYLFESIRYPIGKIHEDTLTTYKILFQFRSIIFVDAKLYYYFINPYSTTNAPWSKKNLSGIEANENQITFFRKNNYTCAMSAVLNTYVNRLYNWITNPPESITNSQIKKYKRIFKRKLRLCFIRYHSICPFSKYEWIYETAFPISMRIYYAVLRRLKHK